MGDKQLAVIATDLLNTIRSNSGVDWWEFRSSRAKMRTAVKRVLRKYGYPPDLEAEAVKGVVKQAEELAAEVSASL